MDSLEKAQGDTMTELTELRTLLADYKAGKIDSKRYKELMKHYNQTNKDMKKRLKKLSRS